MRFVSALLLSFLCFAFVPADQPAPAGQMTAVQGKYIRHDKQTDFLELRAGGVAYLSQGRLKIDGNYKLDGDKIILTSPKMRGEQVGHIRGNTIVDPDGLVWEKQLDNAVASTVASPSMKDTELSIKWQLPTMIKDRVVTKYKDSVWADTYAADKVDVSECRLVLRTHIGHETPPEWQSSLNIVSTRTITFADIDVSKIEVQESATAPDSTLSKPGYVVVIPARTEKDKPFILQREGKPPQSVASVAIRVSSKDMAAELAGLLHQAAVLCGAPDAPTQPNLTASTATPVATAPPAAASSAGPPPAGGQQPLPPNTMTNAEVISMAAAGLSDDVVSTAIRQAPAKAFDLTPTGLIALKTKHVSDAVIAAMQASANPAPAAPVAAPPPAKYDPSLAATAKPAPPPEPCPGIEMMGLYKNEIFNAAMGGGVVEWLARIRNNTSASRIVVFSWIDSYGQQKKSEVQIRGGEIASPRVDMTQSRFIAPVRDLRLVSCD